MPLFKKRETLTQNIAYVAIMAAINVVFVLITTLVPVLMVLLVLVLPLTNVVVTLFCKKKYFLIYAIATLGLCMLVTMWNISDTFLYVIPSMITGFIFGLMVEKKIPAIFILLTTSIIQFGCSYALIPFIKFVFNIDIVGVFLNAFGLAKFTYNQYLVPTFIGFLAVAQSTIAYILIKREIPKLGFEVSDEDKFYFLLPIIEILSCGFFVLCAFLAPEFAFAFMVLILLISTYLMVDMYMNSNIVIWVLSFIDLFITIIIFAACFKYIPKPLGISLIAIFFVLGSIMAITNKYLFKVKNKNDKINNGNKLC